MIARTIKTQTTLTLRAKISRLRAWQRFGRSYLTYQKMRAREGESHVLHLMPYIGEDRGITEVEPTYFYQDAWDFEKIIEAKPASQLMSAPIIRLRRFASPTKTKFSAPTS